MRKSLVLLPIFVAVAVFNVGIGMIMPILPLYAQSYGATAFVVGLMVSAASIGRLVMQGPGGYFADTYGNQKMAAIGFGIFTPSMLLMAFLPTPYLFVCLRFVEGMAEGLGIPALYSIVATRSLPEDTGINFGMFTAFATAGLAIGPVLGGFLGDYWDGRLPFVITAAIAIIVALFLFRLPTAAAAQPVKAAARKKERMGFVTALEQLAQGSNLKTLLPASLFSFLTKFAFAALQVVLPLYLVDVMGISKESLGFIFSLNFFIYSFSQPLAGWLSDKMGNDYDIILGGTIIGLAFLLFPLAPSYPVFLAIFACEAFAAAWVTVSLRRLVGRHMDIANTGKAFGIVGAIGDLGSFSGPLIAGLSYQWVPLLPFVLIGVLSLICSINSLRLLRSVAPPVAASSR